MMTDRQWQITLCLLAKANPPPLLHRYRRASKWCLSEIANHEIHVARPGDMNDPFEFSTPLHINLDAMRASYIAYAKKQLGKDARTARDEAQMLGKAEIQALQQGVDSKRNNFGLVCGTSDPASNRMWAYYGDSHKGICIGYRTDIHPFCWAMSVIYEKLQGPADAINVQERDPSEFCDLISRRKDPEWSFECEYRIPIGPMEESHTRMLPVPPECISEVRLGAKIEPEFRDPVLKAIRKLPHSPKVIQMGCDMERRILTETTLQPDGSPLT